MSKKHELALFFTAIFWGLGFVFMDIALDELNTFSILTIRFLGSALIIFVLAYKVIIRAKKQDVINGAILGIFLFLAFAFQTYGLVFTSASRNAFLTAANVVMVPLIMFLVYKQKITNNIKLGSILMFLGIGFVSGLGTTGFNIGDALTLICALFFALHIIFISKFLTDKNLYVIVCMQMFVAGLISLFLGLVTSSLSFVGASNISFALFYVVVISTCLTFFLQNYGLSKVDSSKGAIILSTEALFGTLGSIVILGETISVMTLIGFVLMFIGIIVVERK